MAKIKPGDRVKFLNEVGSGVVTGIIDREMVMVKTEDGFEYPVLESELLITVINNQDRSDLSDFDIEEPVIDQAPDSPLDKERGGGEKPDYQTPSMPPVRDILIQKSDIVDKNTKVTRREKRANRVSDIEEVDLHIAQIIDDYRDMTSGEIVEIQLSRFRTALEGAIRARQERIVFIHGRGAGKLKGDILKIVDNEYKNCNYQDASFREYGFGATMIFIHHNKRDH